MIQKFKKLISISHLLTFTFVFATISRAQENEGSETFFGVQTLTLGNYNSDSKDLNFYLKPMFGNNFGQFEVALTPAIYFNQYTYTYSSQAYNGVWSYDITSYGLSLQPHLEFNFVENTEDSTTIPYATLLGALSFGRSRASPTAGSEPSTSRNFWNYGWGLGLGVKYFFSNSMTALTLGIEATRRARYSPESIAELVDAKAYWDFEIPVGIRIYF